MPNYIPVPGLVCRLVTVEGERSRQRQEYMQCREPLTWTTDRTRAEVFPEFNSLDPDAETADAYARKLRRRHPLEFIYPCTTQRPNDPAMPAGASRRDSKDWHEGKPNCGVD
jgi:hypothetical protein